MKAVFPGSLWLLSYPLGGERLPLEPHTLSKLLNTRLFSGELCSMKIKVARIAIPSKNYYTIYLLWEMTSQIWSPRSTVC